MSRHAPLAKLATFVGAAALVVISCAPLPAETTPRAIDRDKVSDLFPASSTTIPSSKVPGNICFVPQEEGTDPSELECEELDLASLTAKYLIDALAVGPDEPLREFKGLTSLVPPDTRLLTSDPGDDDDTLIVDLSEQIADVSSPNNVRAYQQIVWTLTAPENKLDITSIGVQVEGERIKVPTANGPLWIATRKDFIERPSDTTTTKQERR